MNSINALALVITVVLFTRNTDGGGVGSMSDAEFDERVKQAVAAILDRKEGNVNNRIEEALEQMKAKSSLGAENKEEKKREEKKGENKEETKSKREEAKPASKVDDRIDQALAMLKNKPAAPGETESDRMQQAVAIILNQPYEKVEHKPEPALNERINYEMRQCNFDPMDGDMTAASQRYTQCKNKAEELIQFHIRNGIDGLTRAQWLDKYARYDDKHTKLYIIEKYGKPWYIKP